MASFNRVVLMGHLTRDPRERTFENDGRVANLGLAVNDSYRNRQGDRVEKACFVDVVVWGNQAGACVRYLHKGSPVLIEGRLQFEQWETDAGRRSRLRVRADRVQFLSRAPGSAVTSSSQASGDRSETGSNSSGAAPTAGKDLPVGPGAEF